MPRHTKRTRMRAQFVARPMMGEILLATGELEPVDLDTALSEQSRSGGRLGQILVANGSVSKAAVTNTLSLQFDVPQLSGELYPVGLLSSATARRLRVVALAPRGRGGGLTPVAVVDPSMRVLAEVEAELGGMVAPRLTDDETIDALLHRVYGADDAEENIRELHERQPQFSAYRSKLSRFQVVASALAIGALAIGLIRSATLTATVLAAISVALFLVTSVFRIVVAARGWRVGPTLRPTEAQLRELDPLDLPVYTVLVPLLGEKPSTVGALLAALEELDYPKHKLDGMLLVEADDIPTLEAVAEVGTPPWLRTLIVPEGQPRTKPRAMLYGLRCARGRYVTVYDAEDQPDPLQLKKAIWGFATLGEGTGCLQAGLSYYNPRQNLLTRWFTLEYDSWFGIFLPGLHRMGAPIPLGGTSNHFPTTTLALIFGWDPYNVTEDADLGVRMARLGLTTAVLDSTTYEEANSRLPSWLRQRSRWIKGYMQTLLVHTRDPRALYHELGLKRTLSFLATLGGAVLTPLLSPILWGVLFAWIVWQPEWIAHLFPPFVYYPSLISLVAANFLLVLLGLVAAVERGHDDLSPYSLLMPVYWLLMSVASYIALVEFVVRPYHWHKTEHGLHLSEASV